MAGSIAIWMDQHEARIVRLSETDPAATPEIRTVRSDVESHHRPVGGTPHGAGLHGAGAGEDSRMLHRREQAADRYHDALLREVADADEIALIGPGSARTAFARHVAAQSDAQHLPSIVANEAADRMREGELVARAREIFGALPPRSDGARVWRGLGARQAGSGG